MSYSAFLARGHATRGFRAAFRFSWSAIDVDGYLTPLFSSDAVGRDNLSRFSDPDLDEALERRAWRATDPADRRLDAGHSATRQPRRRSIGSAEIAAEA